MKIGSAPVVLASIWLVGFSACGSKTATPPPAISVTLNPATAAVYVNHSVPFTAHVNNSTNGAVTWSISGTGCGGASCGTIDTSGLYLAPAGVPGTPNGAVTVKATSVADPSKSASATVTVLAISNVWTWMSGSNQPDQDPVFGPQGVADPASTPGAGEGAATWADAGGNLWLFGCGGYNDLWKFDGANWTWVLGRKIEGERGVYGTKGVADPASHPGTRYAAATWVGPDGKFWLFGGDGADSRDWGGGALNDLWTLDPVALEWTWISGSDIAPQGGIYGTKGLPDPANVPGSRLYAANGMDGAGNIWLYGGWGYDWNGEHGSLGDLWKFDAATKMWTWLFGNHAAAWVDNGRPIELPAVYGTKGVADAANDPGSRTGAASWIDGDGRLWLFGGSAGMWLAYDKLQSDLWKFDPLTLEWTWVSGANTMVQPGAYGTKGIGGVSYIPGARECAVSWIDPSGKFWLFGGYGYDATGKAGYLNDLWTFDPATLEWTWVSGSNLRNPTSFFFGSKGELAPTAGPPGRTRAASWTDAAGNLWVFGGEVLFSSVNSPWIYNDLWRYIR